MRLTFTVPLALTVAQRAAAVVKLDISPTNWPAFLTATRYSLGPLASVDVNSFALLAPCVRSPHESSALLSIKAWLHVQARRHS